ncbi:MAG: hypothetical protein CMN20_03550 [Roseovarius sp.]|nr:hypothetical protein [Roseovarius sp.]
MNYEPQRVPKSKWFLVSFADNIRGEFGVTKDFNISSRIQSHAARFVEILVKQRIIKIIGTQERVDL